MGNTSRQRRAGVAAIAVSALLAVGYLAAPGSAAAAPNPGHSKDYQAQDPTTFTITQTLDALKTGKYTSVELVRAYLDRIATYEPYYNAFTQMYPDAIKDAKASDERRADHEKPRPLEGVPIVIKDSLNIAKLPTTGAWPVTSPVDGGVPLIPAQDAPVVQRLQDA